MKIITLCGSTKFKEHFEQINAFFTLQGYVVLSVGVFQHSGHSHISDDQKLRLDELHKRKIDMADEIFVIDVDGYIGTSTRNEIEYASHLNKPIRFLSQSAILLRSDYQMLVNQ